MYIHKNIDKTYICQLPIVPNIGDGQIQNLFMHIWPLCMLIIGTHKYSSQHWCEPNWSRCKIIPTFFLSVVVGCLKMCNVAFWKAYCHLFVVYLKKATGRYHGKKRQTSLCHVKPLGACFIRFGLRLALPCGAFILIKPTLFGFVLHVKHFRWIPATLEDWV
jgi:hypothetical protein